MTRCLAAGAVIFFYDYALTFQDEVRCFSFAAQLSRNTRPDQPVSSTTSAPLRMVIPSLHRESPISICEHNVIRRIK